MTTAPIYFTAFGLLAGICGLAFGLMWLGYHQRTLYGQIALYLAGVIIAFGAPAAATLVCYRLFVGDWGFLLSALIEKKP